MSVVVIPVYNAPSESIACLDSVLRHTPADVRVLIIDDHGQDREFFEHLDKLRPSLRHRVDIHRPESNGGFVGSCNVAFRLTDPHDVILVNSDVIVGPQWYERMVDAANGSSDVATVSVFTNNGTILSLPHRNSPSPDIVGGWLVDEAAERIARVAEKSRPVIPTAVGHCFLIKRLALNLVGGFDPVFGTGYGEEVDFSQRCIRMGMRHIVADDVFVFHKGSSSFTADARPQQIAHEAIVNERYSWYASSVQRAASDSYSALATAINRASLQLRTPSIAFDGHCFASSWAGTQQTTFELIRAVARNRPDQDFTVVFSAHASNDLITRVTEQPNVRAEIIPNIMEDFAFRFDLIVRPHQVNSTEELRWMKRIANRTIVAQLDFISFSNPTYFESDHSWLSQRELTKLVHATVDGVAWISEYARSDAHRNGVRRHAANDCVIYCGTDSEISSEPPKKPVGLPAIDTPIMTVLGVGYNHKNRVFALRVLEELLRRNTPCHLVLSGQQPRFGSSVSVEQSILDLNSVLRDHVTYLPGVSDAERAWLYAESDLIFYPTVSEGFGLVPFEAAHSGTPTLSTRMGSLDEVLPSGIPTIVAFDVHATATIVERILSEPDMSSKIVRELRERGDHFTWDQTGSLMVGLMDRVLLGPRNNIDSVWAEAPVAAVIHSPDYVARIRASDKRAARYRRVTSLSIGRMMVGPIGSRRRRFAKTLYRRLGR